MQNCTESSDSKLLAKTGFTDADFETPLLEATPENIPDFVEAIRLELVDMLVRRQNGFRTVQVIESELHGKCAIWRFNKLNMLSFGPSHVSLEVDFDEKKVNQIMVSVFFGKGVEMQLEFAGQDIERRDALVAFERALIDIRSIMTIDN